MSAQTKRSQKHSKKRSKKHSAIIGIWVAAIIVIAGAAVFFWQYGSFFAASYPQDERFSPGISIEGIDVSGMTKEQALNTLQQTELYPQGYNIQLVLNEQSVTITGKDLPFDLHLETAVEEAYAYNWHCSQKEHALRIEELRVTPKNFVLTPTLIEDALAEKAAQWCKPFQKEVGEPTVTGFINGSFQVSEGSDGHRVKIEELTKQLKALLETQQTGIIEVPVETVKCTKTSAEVKANMKQLGSYSTVSTNTENGNHNMRLAANATNGTVLQPGEEFSFNATTGNTTDASNGYRPAGSIFDGEFIQEYGGGICQVSSTIYGAALRSNMTIVSRHNHTYPSTYVPIGLDATVSYGILDFVFRNDSDYPVYIAAGMKDTTVWVTFYGYLSPEYDTIEPAAWVNETIGKPAAEYITDDTLAPNPNPMSAATLKRKGNAGYKTGANRTYYKNGVKIKTEPLPGSYYPAFADKYVLPPKGESTPVQRPESTSSSLPESSSSQTPSSKPTSSNPASSSNNASQNSSSKISA